MDETKITIAIISAVISIITVFLSFLLKSTFESYFHVFKLDKNHEYEQRKKIREVISRNKIRIIDSAESLNHRMWNFHKNHDKNWHAYKESKFPNEQYYLTSFVYRVLVFFAWCRVIEKEMVYIDSTLATDKDLYFVKFIKIFPQLLTDGILHKNITQNYKHDKDLFFKNDFLSMVEQMTDSQEIISYEKFKYKIQNEEIDVNKMVMFLSSMSPEKEKLRWDRLQSMHYVLLMFINTYGYDFQYTELSQIEELKNKQHKNPMLINLKLILEKYKLLENKEVLAIINKITQ